MNAWGWCVARIAVIGRSTYVPSGSASTRTPASRLSTSGPSSRWVADLCDQPSTSDSKTLAGVGPAPRCPPRRPGCDQDPGLSRLRLGIIRVRLCMVLAPSNVQHACLRPSCSALGASVFWTVAGTERRSCPRIRITTTRPGTHLIHSILLIKRSISSPRASVRRALPALTPATPPPRASRRSTPSHSPARSRPGSARTPPPPA
jgi:hypothetical protein